MSTTGGYSGGCSSSMPPNGGKILLCAINVGGQMQATPQGIIYGSYEFVGGTPHGVSVVQGTTFDEFVSIMNTLESINSSYTMMFNTKHAPGYLMRLDSQLSLDAMFQFNDDIAYILVSLSSDGIGRSSENNMTNSVNDNADSSHVSICGSGNKYISNVADSSGHLLSSSRFSSSIEGVGQNFSSGKEFRAAVNAYSVAGRFAYKFKRSSPKLVVVECTVDTCPWMIEAGGVATTGYLTIKKFIHQHEHAIHEDIVNVPNVRTGHSQHIIDAIFQNNRDFSPNNLKDYLLTEHGLVVSYHRAWQLRDDALRRIDGKVEDSYKLIPWLCNRIKECNPGSIAEWEMTQNGHFQHLFIAFACSINGFRSGCRPVISMDSTFLNGPYKGSLFAASALDANNQLFPLAYGICSGEDDVNWEWFCCNLKAITDGITVKIVSDRHNSIIKAVGKYFGFSNHIHCLNHLMENWLKIAGRTSRPGHPGKEKGKYLINAVAYSRTMVEYNSNMAKLNEYSPTLVQSVQAAGPEHFAMSHFPSMRWDIMTSNLAECFNSWILKERAHQVSAFVKEHMDRLGSLLRKNRMDMETWKGECGKNICYILEEEKIMSEGMHVVMYNGNDAKVVTMMGDLKVNLVERTCSCRKWQLSGIPCQHACAVLRVERKNVEYYLDEYYRREKQELIYASPLIPLETYDEPTVDSIGYVHDSHDHSQFALAPPEARRSAGRPKKNRIESTITHKRPVHCQICHLSGHNRSTCKNMPPT